MTVIRTIGVGLALAMLLTVTARCGKDEKSSSPPSSAPSAGTAPLADYTNLLISASDIGADTTLGPPQQNPGGLAGAKVTFSNTSKTHTIDDLLIVYTDPAAAAQGAKRPRPRYPTPADPSARQPGRQPRPASSAPAPVATTAAPHLGRVCQDEFGGDQVGDGDPAGNDHGDHGDH